ncbi:collagen alpha-1(I) chain-like [Cervus elaphus]|uniref:collagen alpha-1(I) chain-like n=1 Tax=Cervus elaphus TaxID=9860 RepID=UPI001CC2D48A|nr:collagen alpha-1(I) chain-like [Cervus elaphus]
MAAGGQRPAQKHPGGGKELGSPRCPHQPCCLPELLSGCLPPHKPAGVTASHPRLGAPPPPLTAGVPAASPRPLPQREKKPSAPQALQRTARGAGARPLHRPPRSAARPAVPRKPGLARALRLPRAPPTPSSETGGPLRLARASSPDVSPEGKNPPKGLRPRQPRGPCCTPRPHTALPAFRRVGRPQYPALRLRREGRGGARAVGGRGGRARGAARREVAPPGDRCAAAPAGFPAGGSLGGLRPGLHSRAEAGPARRGAPFPFSGRGPRAERGKLPSPPQPRGARTEVSSGHGRSGPGPESVPAEPHPSQPRGSAVEEAPRLPQAPGSVLVPGSRKPPRTSADRSSDLHSPAAQTRGSRGREGGAAHLGQAGWCSKMSRAQPCGAAASWPGGRGQTGPTNPDSLCAPGTSWKFRRPQGHCGSSASPPKLFLFLQEARLDSCP